MHLLVVIFLLIIQNYAVCKSVMHTHKYNQNTQKKTIRMASKDLSINTCYI